MLITDKFVFIHLPKTGGSYVRNSIHKICHNTARKRSPLKAHVFLSVRNILRYPRRNWNLSQLWKRRINGYLYHYDNFYALKCANILCLPGFHKGISEIPPPYQWKPKLISIRNPFSQMVSYYFYHQLHLPLEKRTHNLPWLLARHPQSKQALSLTEVLSLLVHTDNSDRKYQLVYGTFHVIRQLAPDPGSVLALSEAELLQLFRRGEHRSWLNHASVVHQENLRQELYDFLITAGYPEDIVKKTIYHNEKINISKSASVDHRNFWTPELKQWFYDRSWPLFELFPEYKSELNGIKTKL